MRYLLYSTPFLAFIAASLPILTLGYPEGHDWLFELVRVSEYMTALASGQSPPYWAENLYGGYGSPILLFYAPLYLFLSSLASSASGSIMQGSSLATLLFTAAGALSMFLLLREALPDGTAVNAAAARVAAGLFVLSPYLICDKFLRNANAEYTALCLAPLPLYGLLLIGRRPLAGALVLSASFALTILAHNLTALVAAALIALFFIVLYLPSGDVKLFGRTGGSIALGLGLSLFFWLPALKYKSLVEIGQIAVGKFDFHRQFQPLLTFFGYDRFFSAGLLVPAALIAGLAALLRLRRGGEGNSKRLLLGALIASFFLLILQTRPSIPVWEKAPFLPLFQFPWRMMGPLSLLSALIGGLAFAHFLRGQSFKAVAAAEVILLLVAVANAWPHIKSTKLLDAEVKAQLPGLLSGASIREKGLPATVLDEYLPKGGSKEATKRGGAAVVSAGPGTAIKVLEEGGTRIIFETIGETPSQVIPRRWFFPEWTASVNGTPAEVRRNVEGALSLELPAGQHRVEVELRPPPLRRAGIAISLACTAVWVVLLLALLLKRCGCTRPAISSSQA